MRTKSLWKTILRIVVFVWFITIWIISSIPGEIMPQIDALHGDKIMHTAMYLILSILLFVNYNNGLFNRLNRHHLLMILIMLASMDEAHQYFIKNRSVSPLDLSANLFGVFLGYFTIYTFKTKHDRIY